MNAHPSQYTLDRAALGAAIAPSEADHLSACPRCAGIVSARRAAPPRPAWLEAVRAPPRSKIPSRPSRLRWAALVPVAAAAVAAVVLVPSDRARHAAPEGIRPKGAPQVSVYLKRAETVVTWDGRTPVRTGDRLRLGIRGAGYAYVSIASVPPSPAAPTLLYAGDLAAEGETLLPLGFRVDDRGAAEVLSVVVATQPIPPGEHQTPAAAGRAEPVWSTRITLPKERSR